jgi:hypothetical protein
MAIIQAIDLINISADQNTAIIILQLNIQVLTRDNRILDNFKHIFWGVPKKTTL